MRILAVVPARGGSKRLPGKNIKLLGGKPLICWSIDIAKGIKEVCDVLVSSDDANIASIGSQAGAFVPWLRPSDLATDEATSADVVLHALNWYEAKSGMVDGVMLLQPTSPFRRKETIIEGIRQFTKCKESVVAVSEVKVNPNRCFSIEEHGLKLCLSCAENTGKKIYAVNGSLYIISPEELRENRSFFNEKSVPIVVNDPREELDIDTYYDWWLAERLLEL